MNQEKHENSFKSIGCKKNKNFIYLVFTFNNYMNIQEIIFTGACNWCLEALFQKIKGVQKVESGYYGIGQYPFAFSTKDKLEAVKISYNSNTVSLEDLLEVYFISHNPTIIKWDKDDCFYPLCRSAIFYQDDEQLTIIKNKLTPWIQSIELQNNLPVQTKIEKITPKCFELGEEKYKDYYINNPKDGFCISIIDPKIQKLQTSMTNLLK